MISRVQVGLFGLCSTAMLTWSAQAMAHTNGAKSQIIGGWFLIILVSVFAGTKRIQGRKR
jgi:hypothetical protein